MADQFPSDLPRQVRELQRQVDELYATVKRHPAVPITRSTGSNGFTVVGAPATPSSGVTIGVSGGQIVFRHANGTTQTIPDIPFTQAAAVPDVPVFQSPSNPAQTVQALHAAYQALRDDCQSGIRNNLIQLKTSLRNAGILLG